jgi:uncharacterized membrane protein
MNTDELPFVAPCRRLALRAPLRWLALGWQDFRNSNGRSPGFGAFMALLSMLVSWLAWQFGNLGLLLGLLSGFVLLGPLLAINLYSISDQLQHGLQPSIRNSVRDAFRCLNHALVFMVVLLVIFLVWARAASMLHVFFPSDGATLARDLVVFLSAGTLVGAIFSAVVFIAAAFSLPMLLDRDADAITCVLTSANAVLRNKPVMVLWGLLIVAGVVIGMLTAFIGLVIILPVIGHATWHAYQDVVDASAWPQRSRSGLAD